VPFFRSRPGLLLTRAAFAVVAVGVALTASPLAHPLGFITLPRQFFTALVLFTIVYLVLVELMKTVFYAEPAQLGGEPHRTRGRAHRIQRQARQPQRPIGPTVRGTEASGERIPTTVTPPTLCRPSTPIRGIDMLVIVGLIVLLVAVTVANTMLISARGNS
jgi:hypothetical protein